MELLRETYKIPKLPLSYDLETKAVLKQLSQSNRWLAELKGMAKTIPNEQILIRTLTLQEAQDSTEVKNIVTTQDDLYKASLDLSEFIKDPAAKEVLNYREAITLGFELLKQRHLLTNNVIKEVQEKFVHNRAGFRNLPGTTLKDEHGNVIYVPPQDGELINSAMDNLEAFINDERLSDMDPLIKMAIIHHQFESIHPFYNGNGRTGRIVNILYLIATGLLDYPILYLSRYITHHKAEYYHLIQSIRDKEGDNFAEWEQWVLFVLKGVEETSSEAIVLIGEISKLMSEYKQELRQLFKKLYRQELLNNLFTHPYTKVGFVEHDLMITNKTASRYLDKMVKAGLLEKRKLGRENYYINTRLLEIFINVGNGTLRQKQ